MPQPALRLLAMLFDSSALGGLAAAQVHASISMKAHIDFDVTFTMMLILSSGAFSFRALFMFKTHCFNAFYLRNCCHHLVKFHH